MRPGAPAGLLVAMVLSSCGSAPLSGSALRLQASEICATANQQATRLKPPASPAATAAFLTRGIAILRPEVSQLQALRGTDAGTALRGLQREIGARRGQVDTGFTTLGMPACTNH